MTAVFNGPVFNGLVYNGSSAAAGWPLVAILRPVARRYVPSLGGDWRIEDGSAEADQPVGACPDPSIAVWVARSWIPDPAAASWAVASGACPDPSKASWQLFTGP